jgi:hypothetical protein
MIAITVGVVLVGTGLVVAIVLSAPPIRQSGSHSVRTIRAKRYRTGHCSHLSYRGRCWERSIASNRPDTWRCTIQNEIYDPCFSNPYGLNEVACPSAVSPSRAVIINLTHSLPYSTQNSSVNTQGALTPWTYQIANGSYCRISTGANTIIAGLAVWGSCANGEQFVGTVNRNTHPWTVLTERPDTSSLIRIGIERIWV